jgi:hypothetical protein
MEASIRAISGGTKDGTRGTGAPLRTEAPPPRGAVLVLERSAIGLLLTLAAISFVAHMLVAGNYGYFRDEPYYIADGRHLQAGYSLPPCLQNHNDVNLPNWA